MGGTEKLIAAVKKHPVLYADLENNTTKNKNAAWEIVARLTADPGGVPACKKKWKSLRDCYRKHLRAQSLGPTSTNPISRYKTWCRAPLMEFMREPLKASKLVDEFQQTNQSWYDLPDDHFTNSEDDTNAEQEIHFDFQSINQPKKEEIVVDCAFLSEIENQNVTAEPMMETYFEEAMLSPPIATSPKKSLPCSAERMPSTNYTFTPKEDVDYIFIGYAKTMKKFSPKRQARLKSNISKLFMEEELAQLAEDEENEHGGRSKLQQRKKKRRLSAVSSVSSWMDKE